MKSCAKPYIKGGGVTFLSLFKVNLKMHTICMYVKNCQIQLKPKDQNCKIACNKDVSWQKFHPHGHARLIYLNNTIFILEYMV